MLEKIVTDKDLLSFLIKKASLNNKIKKTSSVFENLIKISQDFSSKDIMDYQIQRIQSQLVDELSSLSPYEKKQNRVEGVLEKSMDLIAQYFAAQNIEPEIQSEIYKFLTKGFIPYASKYFEKFNGKNASQFDLKAFLNGTIKQALLYSNLKKSMPSRTTQMPVGKEGTELEIGSYEEPRYETIGEASEEDKMELLEKHFKEILQSDDQDLAHYYILQSFLPQYKKLKENYNLSEGKDKDILLAIDKLYEDFVEFYKNTFHKQKRIYEEGKSITDRREFTLTDLQNQVNNALSAIDLDKLSTNILKQNYYKLPKWVERYDPNLIKEVLKAMIKSEAIIEAKKKLDVPIPGFKIREPSLGDKPTKGGMGRSPVSQHELIHRIVENQITKLYTNEEERDKLIDNLITLLGSEKTQEGDIVHRKTQDLIYSYYQHISPMVIAGLIHEYEERLGEDFANMSPQQQSNLVKEIHSKVHGFLPHTFKDMGKTKYKTISYHDLGESAQEITERHILERIQQAANIKKGVAKPGAFMDTPQNTVDQLNTVDPSNEQSKESSLQILIKKYASQY